MPDEPKPAPAPVPGPATAELDKQLRDIGAEMAKLRADFETAKGAHAAALKAEIEKLQAETRVLLEQKGADKAEVEAWCSGFWGVLSDDE